MSEWNTHILIGARACQEWHVVAETRHGGDMPIEEFVQHLDENGIEYKLLDKAEVKDEGLLREILFFLDQEGQGNSTDFSIYMYVHKQKEDNE